MSDFLVIEQQDILAQGGEDTVLQEEQRVIEVLTVAEQGPPGPPGPPGGGAGATYTHTQSVPAAVWTVAHNLGRFPSLSVVDTLGAQLFPDVAYIDADIARITHSVPLIGRVYCN